MAKRRRGKTSAALVLKRCGKCNKTLRVRTRVRHCLYPERGKMGLPTGYACYGTLTVVATVAKSKRDDYEGKLHKAHQQLTQSLSRVRRAALACANATTPAEMHAPLSRVEAAIRSVKRWQKRVKYYDTKIGKLAAQAAERTRRIIVGDDTSDGAQA